MTYYTPHDFLATIGLVIIYFHKLDKHKKGYNHVYRNTRSIVCKIKKLDNIINNYK